MFRHDGITVKDPHAIGNCFNNYFTNIGAEQASKIKGCSNSFRDSLCDSSVNSIFFNPTNPIEVMKIVASLMDLLRMDIRRFLNEFIVIVSVKVISITFRTCFVTLISCWSPPKSRDRIKIVILHMLIYMRRR